MQSLRDKIECFDPSLPLEKARTIPSLWYLDEELYAAERKTVFGQSWQMVGRVDQVEKPGSFLTATIAAEPVVVARDREGELHAFTNVCRHKAARVVVPDCGHASFFQCRYHGWTYDLAGRLKGTPEFDGVDEFTKEANALPRWRVETWGPLVFVTANAEAPTLAQFLAPLPEKAQGQKLDELKFVKRLEYDLECNWKVFVDNYLDGGYHVNTLHPALAGVLNYSQYRTEIHGNTSVQYSPLETKKDTKVGDISVASVRQGDFAYYWWVYPNLMINLYEGVMDTNLVLPLGPNRCRVIFDFFFAKTEGEAAQKYISDSTAVAHQVQLEDQQICEDVQKGLGSQTYDTGRFSVRREIAGYYFHQLLSQHLKRALS